MTNEMNALLEFVRAHKNWQDLLKKKPYNLKAIKPFELHPNWYILVYNLVESDMKNPIVRACRGPVIEVDGDNVKCICQAYDKFFNWNDPNSAMANLDWASARLYDKCVSGDTIVTTENGKKTIKEVVEGNDKFVLSVNPESNDVELKEIEKRWQNDNPDSEWFEVELESGKKIKITGNDRLMMINGAYRRVDELCVGDELVVH